MINDRKLTALVVTTTSRQLAATASNLAGERDAKIKSAGEWRARASAVASPMDPGDGPVTRTIQRGRFTSVQAFSRKVFRGPDPKRSPLPAP